jgi:ketosteroid isomerase-like protein
MWPPVRSRCVSQARCEGPEQGERPADAGLTARVKICEDRRVRTPLPPVAAVIGFIDAINRGDVDRLVALMSPDHRLQVLQELPVTGREANREAWSGYVAAFPDYVIYPDHLVHSGDDVLVLGSTTGSHLGLSDQEERQLKVIWRATVRDGLLTLWQIIEDMPGQRALLGLTDV